MTSRTKWGEQKTRRPKNSCYFLFKLEDNFPNFQPSKLKRSYISISIADFNWKVSFFSKFSIFKRRNSVKSFFFKFSTMDVQKEESVIIFDSWKFSYHIFIMKRKNFPKFWQIWNVHRYPKRNSLFSIF